MRLRNMAIGLLIVLPLGVYAQEPSAAPQRPEMRSENEVARPRPYGGMGFRRRMMEQVDYEQVEKFWREYSPRRWAYVESLPEDGPDRRLVMAFVSARWRTLQGIKEDDPQLYDLKVRQIQLEDSIYGMLAQTQSAKEREPLRSDIRQAVREMLTGGLTEREKRIQQLQTMLKAEEEKLANDRRHLEATIDRRTNALVADGPGALRAGMGHWGIRPGAATRPANPE